MEIFGGTVMAMLVLVLGIILGDYTSTTRWQSDLINRGMALYCPDTGEWAFKGECEK